MMMWLVLAQGPASAHPHIFVDAKAGFHIAEDGSLTGLYISWTYDPFTTLFLFDALDLDRDKDGQLNDDDYAAILRGETEWADGYVGDIYLEVNEKVQPHLRPVDAKADYSNDQITIRFDLPLAEPVNVPGQDVSLRLYDPNFYYAYSVVEITNPVPMPTACEAWIYAFEPDAVTGDLLVALGTLSREETPEQADVGRLFSDEVVLSCD